MSKRQPTPSFLVPGALWEHIQAVIGELPYEEVCDLMEAIKAVPAHPQLRTVEAETP